MPAEPERHMDTVNPDARASADDEIAAPKQDLRAWLAALKAAGEVTEVNGAERQEEIGGIVDIFQRTQRSRAVLFARARGDPAGQRVLATILTSVRRINLTLGLPLEGSEIDLVQFWRRYMKDAKAIPPRTVSSGPLLDNVASGADVD